MSSDYHQRSVVAGLHGIPRFGHSKTFSSLASSNEEERQNYTNGIVSFSIFLSVIAFVWCAVLLILKFYVKEKRVGCAAGGAVVDVTEMRLNKLSRSTRRRRILRNWRVQYVLLLCCLLIPTLSFLFVNHGFVPLFDSLEEVQEMSGIARENAKTGIEIATDLMFAQNRLNGIISSLDAENSCPNYSLNEYGTNVFQSFNSSLNNAMEDINNFVDGHVTDMVLGLSQVTQTTLYVEESIDSAHSYDWLVKGFLVALNAVNVLLFVGVCLTRNSVYHYTYQQFLMFLVVPSFCVLLLGFVAATCVSAGLAMVNADFCSGGEDPYGSPQGTLQDIFAVRGYNSSNLPYQALLYYSSDCNGENPFSFLYNFQTQVQEQRSDVFNLLSYVQNETSNLAEVCGEEFFPLVNTSGIQIDEKLGEFQDLLATATNLTSCSNVQPLLRRLINGAPCSEAPRGLAWLFGTTTSILFVGLTMLSVRAGLYNPVLKPRRIKRREREFQEYKDYMSNYYKTEGWKIDPTPEKKKSSEMTTAKTFDTEETEDDTSSSSSNHSDPNIILTMVSDNQSVYIEDGDDASSRPTVDTAKAASYARTDSSTVASSPVSRSNYTASARSRMRYRDPGVVYYESDSDESTEGESSNMSDVFGRLFLVRRAPTESTIRASSTSLSSFEVLPSISSSPSNINRSRSDYSLRLQAATPLTPSSGEKSSPRVSFEESGSDVTSIRETLESQPLSPSPDKKQFPPRPHKKHKHRCRTIGGSMMNA